MYLLLLKQSGPILSMVLQSDMHTTWLKEYLIKEKSDIDILARYMPSPKCDVAAVNKEADEYGNRGLFRGFIPCFEGFGQPGCWQDASCLFGTENLIVAALIKCFIFFLIIKRSIAGHFFK
jgi:uroporphyrinogen decarboxylase